MHAKTEEGARTVTRGDAAAQSQRKERQRPSIDDAHEHRGFPWTPPMHVVLDKAVELTVTKPLHTHVLGKKRRGRDDSVEVDRERGSDRIFHISVEGSRGQWTASTDDEASVVLGDGSDGWEPIQEESNEPLKFQVVVDEVGHGVAPDQPRLEPQLVELSPQTMNGSTLAGSASVSTKGRSVDETLGLALAGGAVLLVAVVVIAFARRQQRKYEVEQQLSQESEGGVNNEAVNVTRDCGDVVEEGRVSLSGRNGQESKTDAVNDDDDAESVDDCWV